MKILEIQGVVLKNQSKNLWKQRNFDKKSGEMESHKKNSNKDTVPSDCEEISENAQLNSSLDTAFLFQERKHRHYKSKYEHRRRKPSHRGNSIPNDKHKKHCRHHSNRCEQKQQSSDHRNKLETVTKQTIKQEIHVQKDNFKCIINLNTTVCDHQNSIIVEKTQCSKKQHRPVPQCQKPLCRSSRPCETKFHMHSKESCKAGSHQRTRDSVRTANLSEPKHMLYKCRHWRHEKRPTIEKAIRKEIKKQYDQHTSASRLDLKDDHITNKSLDKYSDIPMSYKNAVKHSKKYESKLDTLIKRTKERERKLVEQSRNNNNASSSYTDISSDEFPTYSEYAASLHSRSTLILDTQPREIGFSPSIDSFYPKKTEKYSPTSCNKYFDSDFDMKIKSEFIMDSGAYSPIQHPMQKLFYNEELIKKDIKSEPKEEKFRV